MPTPRSPGGPPHFYVVLTATSRGTPHAARHAAATRSISRAAASTTSSRIASSPATRSAPARPTTISSSRAGRCPRSSCRGVRIHAPLTHVPYHERIDQGFVNFVNNDHCLLSARATTHLPKLLPQELAGLPMAQTIWYIPTGLDIWNQKINKAPGHYARSGKPIDGAAGEAGRALAGPDSPSTSTGRSTRSSTAGWTSCIAATCSRPTASSSASWRSPPHRKEALAQLCFAGLIDLQDRVYLNRSYTTGHKSFRARATVELGNFVGWDNAHHVLYAGALDIARRPALVLDLRDGLQLHHALHREAEDLGHPLWRRDAEGSRDPAPDRAADAATRPRSFLDVVLHGQEPGIQEALTPAAARRQGAAPDPRRAADRRRAGAARDAGHAQLLDPAALLRVSEHARLVLRHLRASAAPEAALRRDHLPQSQCLALASRPATTARSRVELPAGADRKSPAQMLEHIVGRDHRARRAAGDRLGPRLSRGRRRSAGRWRSSWRCAPAASATIRTTRNSASCSSRTTARTAASTATACCSPACSTPPCIASTATSSKPAAATARRWALAALQ